MINLIQQYDFGLSEKQKKFVEVLFHGNIFLSKEGITARIKTILPKVNPEDFLNKILASGAIVPWEFNEKTYFAKVVTPNELLNAMMENKRERYKWKIVESLTRLGLPYLACNKFLKAIQDLELISQRRIGDIPYVQREVNECQKSGINWEKRHAAHRERLKKYNPNDRPILKSDPNWGSHNMFGQTSNNKKLK